MPDSSKVATAGSVEPSGSLAGVALWLAMGVAAMCTALYSGFSKPSPAPAVESAPVSQKVSLWPEIVPSSLDAPAASDSLAPTP